MIDAFEVDIPVRMGERLSLVLEWTLGPTASIKTNSIRQKSRYSSPVSYFGPAQQASQAQSMVNKYRAPIEQARGMAITPNRN